MNVRKLLLAVSLSLCLPVSNSEETTTGAEADVPAMHVVVEKNPGCGCCDIWADHLRDHGFDVEVSENPKLYDQKKLSGIPSSLYSCHTAHVGGYFIEGHVPAQDILALLRLKPHNIRGLAVPGMPLGSPGMEHPRPQAFDTIAVGTDGKSHVFASHEAGEDFSAASD